MMVHFVYLKNYSADELTVRLKLKLWGILPRTVYQMISAHSNIFVPSEVQKKPFLLEILRENQVLHTLEVSGFCELTVKASEDNSTSYYSVTVRLANRNVTESKKDDTTLLRIMQLQNCYDVLQVNCLKY